MLKDALANMHHYFDEIVLERGRLCQKQGKILSVKISEGLIKGRVKGSQSQLYDVHINLRADAEHFARCTCPYTLNCKHAAACLFEIQSRRNLPETGQLPTHVIVAKPPVKATPDWKESKPTQLSNYIVHYEIEFDKGHKRGIPVRLYRIKRLKSGGMGKPIEMTNEDDISSRLSTTDQIIAMKLLTQTGLLERRNNIRDVETLKQVVATNMAFVKPKFNAKKHKLTWGKEIQATLGWELYPEGEFHLHLYAKGKAIDHVFLWRSPFYLNRQNWSLHDIQTNYSPELLRSLMSLAPVSIDQIKEPTKINMQMNEQLPALPTFNVTTKNEKPFVKIVFDAVEKNQVIPNSSQDNAQYIFFVNIYAVYHGISVSYSNTCHAVYVQKQSVIERYKRCFEDETEKLEEIKKMLDLREPNQSEKLYLAQVPQCDYIAKACLNEKYLGFLFEKLLPHLHELGYLVEFNHPIFQQPIDIDDLTWFSELSETKSDMLAYELGVIIDGQAVNLVPLVVEVIHKYTPMELQQLPDDYRLSLGLNHSKAISIDIARIRPLINFIIQFGEHRISQGRILKLEKYQAIWLQEMEQASKAAKARWQGSEQFRNQLRQFIAQDYTIDMPTRCLATLREYQVKGVAWLQSLRICHFSGILADDMGLGKTVQTLAHLQIEKEHNRLTKPSLIVAPTSLVMNWFQEAKRFTPDLKVLVYHGAERVPDEMDHYDMVVTTYGLIQRNKEQFLPTKFYYLILDEAQFIKNARAKTTLVVQQIQATHRICLTGTPLENHLGELWSLFHFLMPGFLGTARQFRQAFKFPIEKEQSQDRQIILSNRVSPFLLRRTKKEVVKELPEKTVITRMVELSGPQRDLYEAIRLTMESKVRQAIADRGLNKSQIIILDALLKMRQVCCDPRLLKEEQAVIAKGHSAKLDLLEDLLLNSVDEGRRILLFSQFTSMLSIIENRCQQLKLPYLKLTGQTQNRHKLVESFQQGDVPLFLISLKAGGTGLNLTAADTVIHYDPWWNPAVEDQATDRTHRIGQVNPVFVYRLICAGTVEEAMLTLQDKKRKLISGVYEQNLLDKQMDIDTLLNLFQPITDTN
ncbi:SNF2-related protein [Legionella sp. W05-934-2]|jgi:superfamily II DNA or RNA helicase|uniref:DEAD/DEAH box helicase n=1 Tax=Legionella sp. W05-934-2 TaxID=1198649 RepID=UPI0034637A3E